MINLMGMYKSLPTENLIVARVADKLKESNKETFTIKELRDARNKLLLGKVDNSWITL